MTRKQLNRDVLIWLALPVAVCMAAMLGACGKKAPPIPPKRPPLPQVTELKGRLDSNIITLVWRHLGDAQGVKSYVVMRAQFDAAKPPCQGCPMVFQKVGDVTVHRDTETVEFKEQVPTGFVYTYKVQPVGSSGDRGPESNTVVIEGSAH